MGPLKVVQTASFESRTTAVAEGWPLSRLASRFFVPAGRIRVAPGEAEARLFGPQANPWKARQMKQPAPDGAVKFPAGQITTDGRRDRFCTWTQTQKNLALTSYTVMLLVSTVLPPFPSVTVIVTCQIPGWSKRCRSVKRP